MWYISCLKSHDLLPISALKFRARAEFKRRDWEKIVGFQTRNVPHRAHEYLQRVALEQVDGLFVQPLLGRKKIGDYTAEAILAGYTALIEGFYPQNRGSVGRSLRSAPYNLLV